MSATPVLAAPASWRFLKDTTPQLCGLEAPPLYGQDFRLRRDAAQALEAMQAAAKKEHILLQSRSSYRSFSFQTQSWNRRMKELLAKGKTLEEALEINLRYVAIPGTSRHHWGTDIDLLDAAHPAPRKGMPIRHFKPNGRYHTMYKWLQKHGPDYGFFLTYTDKPERKGFYYEPWHYSYAPLAKGLLKNMLVIDYQDLWRPHTIIGKELMTAPFMKKYLVNYLLGINPSLLPEW